MFGLLTDFVPLPFLSHFHFLELGVQNGIVPQIDVKDVGFVIVRFPVFVSFLLRQLTWVISIAAELRLPEQLRGLYSPHWSYRGE